MSYTNLSLKKYIEVLAARTPVPGGGSAAALTGALGVALIEMVARYSRNNVLSKTHNRKVNQIIKQSVQLRKRLLKLVDLDAQAYMRVVKSRKAKAQVRRKALRSARAVPMEVCRLCDKAVTLTPFLAHKGNKNLISDVEAALELLLAAFKSARVNIRINQS